MNDDLHFKMKINYKKIFLLLSYIDIIVYILLGNAFVYSVFGFFNIKISEIVSVLSFFLYIPVRRKIHIHLHEKQILIWLLFSAVSGVFGLLSFRYTTLEFAKGLVYHLRIILLIFTVKFIQYSFQINHISTDSAIRFILNCYFLVCVIGAYQLIKYPVAYEWYQVFRNLGTVFVHPDPHMYRMLSTYMDPNFLAACLLIPFTITLHQYQNGYTNHSFYMAVYSVCIVLTVSRSGFLGLAITVLLAFLKPRITKQQLERNFVLIILLSMSLSILMMKNARITTRILNSMDDRSTYARFHSWDVSLDVFSASPIIGVGYNMLQAYLNVHHIRLNGSDSSLILILLSSGILGTIYFLYSIIKDADKLRKKNNPYFKDITDIFLSALVICNFNNLLFYVLWLFPVLLISSIYLELHGNRNVPEYLSADKIITSNLELQRRKQFVR